MTDWQRLRGSLDRHRRDRGGLRSLALHPLVLALFVALAGPLLAIQVFDVHHVAASTLALPGYVVLSVLAVAFTLAGLESGPEVGTLGFYLLHAGWSYLVALATVGAGRAIVRRVRPLVD